MAKYSGWKQMHTVNIVYDDIHTIQHNNKIYMRAIICDGGVSSAAEKELANCLQITPNAKVVETENKDFTVTLAEYLSPSGCAKLSDWVAIFEKSGLDPFYICIDARFIANLVFESDIHNGEVSEKVMFAKNSGYISVLHEHMTAYKEMLADTQLKRNLSKNKTTKWKIGYSYNTPTRSDTFFGYFSPICKMLNEPGYYGVDLNFCTLDKPYYSESTTLDKGAENFTDFTEVTASKCPSRQEGEKRFDESPTHYKDFTDRVAYYMHKNMKRNSNFNMYYWHWSTIEPIFNIFRQAPDTTIKLMEELRDHFATHIDNISKGIRNKDEQGIADEFFIVYRLVYGSHNNDLKVVYDGTTRIFKSDYIGYFDYLIDILKKEKAKL